MTKKKQSNEDKVAYKVGQGVGLAIGLTILAVIIVLGIKLITWLWGL